MWGYHDVTDPPTGDGAARLLDHERLRPLAGQIVRVESDAWGPLRGALLNLSYGYGKIFVVPHEIVDGQMQGGMAALPIAQFPTGVMRGRFHPASGQLYACGMYAWAGTQTQPGGLYRVRYTGKPVWVPLELSVQGRHGDHLQAPLDPATATDHRNYAREIWAFKRLRSTARTTSTSDPLRLRLRRSRRTAARSCWPCPRSRHLVHGDHVCGQGSRRDRGEGNHR